MTGTRSDRMELSILRIPMEPWFRQTGTHLTRDHGSATSWEEGDVKRNSVPKSNQWLRKMTKTQCMFLTFWTLFGVMVGFRARQAAYIDAQFVAQRRIASSIAQELGLSNKINIYPTSTGNIDIHVSDIDETTKERFRAELQKEFGRPIASYICRGLAGADGAENVPIPDFDATDVPRWKILLEEAGE